MKKTTFNIKQRDASIKPKKLRERQVVPGNLFGSSLTSQAVQFDLKGFVKLYELVGESAIVYLNVDEKQIPAMIDEVQLDPITDMPIHATFKAVDLKEKIKADIPVRFEGEFEVADAVMVRVRDEIEVEALPTDLPEEFVIDVEKLKEIGQSIAISDLEYDKSKVEIIVGEEGVDAPIVLVQQMEEEKEEEEEIETTIIGEEEEGGEKESASEEEKKDQESDSEQKE